MPVRPVYEWEQTAEEVLLRVTIKGFRPEAIDVFLADVFVKVNAAPTYLLLLDLPHPIDPQRSSHHVDPADRSCLRLRLRKQEPGVWASLCVAGEEGVRERRAAAVGRAEEDYNRRLQERVGRREKERRRMTEEQWEVEKAQRRLIEGRVKEEREEAETDLYMWEDEQKQQRQQQQQQEKEEKEAKEQHIPTAGCCAPRSPADIALQQSEKKETTTPSVRHHDTVVVPIEFTPKLATMPTRSRGEDEYYRRSRYKPTRIEDSPMFWKERADKHYKHHEWQAAADAYTESIKRDGAFLTCVSNRAACFIHLFEYKRAIEDCTLALTMLSNTPASELTQERYRYLMMKLHARRGAAYCWGRCCERGIEDLRIAAAYGNTGEDDDVLADYQLVESYMKERGLLETKDPLEDKLREASSLYYSGKYAEAAALCREVLEVNPYDVKVRNNLSAMLLQQGLFHEVLEETSRVLSFCQEVAEALNCPGALSTNLVDSDDDDDIDNGDGDDDGNGDKRGDDMVRRRNAAARKVGEKSGHVYALLKACVRGAAAHCGLKDYRKALQLLEQAVRITPYDDDLQDDYNRVAEKLQMETLVAASTARA